MTSTTVSPEANLNNTSQSTPLHEQVISVLLPPGSFPVVIKKYGLSLQAMETVTPEMLSLLLTYLTTGSEMARFAVAREFRAILMGVESVKTSSPNKKCTYVDAYRETLGYFNGLSMSEQMTLGWHFNNVASEFGMDSIKVDTIIHHAVENCSDGMPAGETPDVYWRGVSALHIACRDNTSLPDLQKHLDFIREAGSSPDMMALVTLAHQRSNLSVSHLRSLMSAQQAVVTSIQSGVL